MSDRDDDRWHSLDDDGPLELRPFLRAWARDRWSRARDRWSRLVAVVWPRPAPPPRPMPPGRAATLKTVAAIYKQAYGTEAVHEAAWPTSPIVLATLKRTPPIVAGMVVRNAAATGPYPLGIVEGPCHDHPYPAVKVLWGADRVVTCAHPSDLAAASPEDAAAFLAVRIP